MYNDTNVCISAPGWVYVCQGVINVYLQRWRKLFFKFESINIPATMQFVCAELRDSLLLSQRLYGVAKKEIIIIVTSNKNAIISSIRPLNMRSKSTVTPEGSSHFTLRRGVALTAICFCMLRPIIALTTRLVVG